MHTRLFYSSVGDGLTINSKTTGRRKAFCSAKSWRPIKTRMLLTVSHETSATPVVAHGNRTPGIWTT